MRLFHHRHGHRRGRRLLMLGAALILGTAAFTGCRGRHDPGAKAEFIVKKVSRELDLTAQQQATLNTIKDDILRDMQNAREKRSSAFAEIEKQINSTDLDQNKLREMFQDRQQKMNEMFNAYLPRLAEFHKTLTPEQKKKLTERMAKMREHFED